MEVWLNLTGAAEKSEGFVRWTVPRSANFHSLVIVARRAPDGPPPDAVSSATVTVEMVVLANVVSALAATGPYLRELTVDWDGPFVLSGFVSTMYNLRIASFTATALTVRSGMGSLPCLRDLRLRSVSSPLLLVGASSELLPGRLQALRMDGCHLRHLPPCVAHLRHLTDLVLSNNAITPQELDPLSRMTSLQQLTLMGTRMTHLPRSLSSLTGLRVLYLDGVTGNNNAAAMAAVQMDVDMVDAMHMSTQAQISEVLAPLKSLGILSLGSSRLAQFPSELARVTSLRALYLDNNPTLSSLPSGPYLRRLCVLGIDWRVLFTSHTVLLEARMLRKLCLTSIGGVEEVPDEERDADAVSSTLLKHPSLRQVLLPMVDGNRLPIFIPALNVALKLASCPSIQVEAVTYSGISNEWIEFLVELEREERGSVEATFKEMLKIQR